jgi:hypothetical protein
MSKGEVKSLNDLAMAHGGHLTINPHTGLPEAGFLSRMLPMIAGGALAATGVGAPVAALMVGGGYAAATGSLKKGIIAGLGAYGGAGIGSALASSGQAVAAVEPSMTPPVEAVPATPPSVMTQPPPTSTFANVGDPNMTQMFNQTTSGFGPPAPAGVSGPAISPESIGFKPLTPAPNMVTTPAANAAYESSLANQQAAFQNGSFGQNLGTMGKGVSTLGSEAGRSAFMNNLEAVPGTYGAKTTLAAAAVPLLMPEERKQETPAPSGPGQQYTYSANPTNPFPTPDPYGRERRYFNPVYTPRMAGGGPVEAMSNANAIGANTGYPMADINKGAYATPWQTPISRNVIADTSDTGVSPITGQMTNFADGGLSDAHYNLGGYSDGGRLLRGPGDGVSDSIPAVIGEKQPARLADGEFVVPARIVSELGNGSTEAGARKLYAMMDRIQSARSKTIGKGKIAKNSRAEKHLPA